MSIDEYSMTRRENVSEETDESADGKESYEPQNIDLERYRDPDGLSLSKMELGFWLLSHKQKGKEVLFFSLFSFGVFCWLFFFFQFGAYVIKGIQDEKMFTKFILYQNTPDHSYFSSKKLMDIEFLPVRVLVGNSDTRDIVGQIKNPNPNHWARFRYQFHSNGNKVSEKEGFILPGQQKYLLALGQEASSLGNSVQLTIEDIRWARVNPHDFGRWERFEQKHLSFEFENIRFIEARESEISDRLPLNIVSFDLKNRSDYNYWNVPLIITLYSFGDLVSVSKYDVNDFESGQDRSISFTWPGKLPSITEVKIVPDLDITKLDIYKDFKAPTGTFR